MHPDNFRGPDGFNPTFFQQFWHLCGDDVFTTAKVWLQRGYFPSSLNETNICLIPKCESPTSTKEFRPISLCNVLYKMVSKLLANQLKLVIEKCISEEQSTFVEGRSNLFETRELMEILKTYENASGQEINLSKSEIFFSRNMSRAAQKDLSELMGVRHVMGTGTYLGVPSMVGRSKKATFAYIKDQIWRKISSWRSRPLSKAGKEIMIKSVLQAIPSYVISIRWMSWERLACAKGDGGLGFRDFKAFNMTKPESLVARIFKARWSVGDGSKIKVMADPWLRGQGCGWVSAPQPQVPLIREVQEDKLVWQEEQNREYTVKSRYRIVMKAKEVGRRRGMEGSWKCLWQIRAPPKAKHTLWRICRDCLPTRAQQRRHYVQCPATCELCNGENEDTWHVLFDFEMIRNCWTAASLQGVITDRLNAFNNVKQVIFDICSKESKETAGRVATMIWMRNNIINDYRQDKGGSNAMSMPDSTTAEALRLAVGAYMTRMGSLSVPEQTGGEENYQFLRLRL
ncbi:hypothetical protein TSUD_286400 [Trifolium subterraneum]|uniref:Reverse transcriptase zinc-binding domain-containing protein n=1 Tax=Trifolium subterraneum TaxID=3900 RepID=A0A2Z6NX29_TRISU|nr:hypothetical protein TSUD_286400 [Trifolium subterraneum]